MQPINSFRSCKTAIILFQSPPMSRQRHFIVERTNSIIPLQTKKNFTQWINKILNLTSSKKINLIKKFIFLNINTNHSKKILFLNFFKMKWELFNKWCYNYNKNELLKYFYSSYQFCCSIRSCHNCLSFGNTHRRNFIRTEDL